MNQPLSHQALSPCACAFRNRPARLLPNTKLAPIISNLNGGSLVLQPVINNRRLFCEPVQWAASGCSNHGDLLEFLRQFAAWQAALSVMETPERHQRTALSPRCFLASACRILRYLTESGDVIVVGKRSVYSTMHQASVTTGPWPDASIPDDAVGSYLCARAFIPANLGLESPGCHPRNLKV